MSNGEKVRVLVVDDHMALRQGLTHLVNSEPDLEVVGEASEGRAAVELSHQLRPDVVIMDVCMPGMGGVEATRAIHSALPHVQVIGVSMFEEADGGDAMRQAGAVNYLNKQDLCDSLIPAIRACRPCTAVLNSAASQSGKATGRNED